MPNKINVATKTTYTPIAKWLHWITAIFIIVIVSFGWSLDDIQESELSEAISYHALGGLIFLSFLCLRILWRIGNPPPILPETVSRLQKIAAIFIHIWLYLLMLIVPITGIITAVAHEVPIVILGSLDLQEIFSFLGENNFDIKREIHAQVMHVLFALIIGHVSAALIHQFWFKDKIIERITPNTYRKRNKKPFEDQTYAEGYRNKKNETKGKK